MALEINEKEVTDLIKIQISKSVLDSLTQESRDAIIAKGIREAMGDYGIKREIEKVIIGMAVTHLTEYLERPETIQLIKEQTIQVFHQFMNAFNQALMVTLLSNLDKDAKYNYSTTLGQKLRDILEIPKSNY